MSKMCPYCVHNVSKMCPIFGHLQALFVNGGPTYFSRRCAQTVSKMCQNILTYLGHFAVGFPCFKKCLKRVQNVTLVWTYFGHNHHTWTPHGHDLDTLKVWTCFGHLLDTFWTCFGHITIFCVQNVSIQPFLRRTTNHI